LAGCEEWQKVVGHENCTPENLKENCMMGRTDRKVELTKREKKG